MPWWAHFYLGALVGVGAASAVTRRALGQPRWRGGADIAVGIALAFLAAGYWRPAIPAALGAGAPVLLGAAVLFSVWSVGRDLGLAEAHPELQSASPLARAAGYLLTVAYFGPAIALALAGMARAR